MELGEDLRALGGKTVMSDGYDFKSGLHLSVTEWSWVSFFTFLNVSFPICKVGELILVPTTTICRRT